MSPAGKKRVIVGAGGKKSVTLWGETGGGSPPGWSRNSRNPPKLEKAIGQNFNGLGHGRWGWLRLPLVASDDARFKKPDAPGQWLLQSCAIIFSTAAGWGKTL
jgi:hypothetical protein